MTDMVTITAAKARHALPVPLTNNHNLAKSHGARNAMHLPSLA